MKPTKPLSELPGYFDRVWMGMIALPMDTAFDVSDEKMVAKENKAEFMEAVKCMIDLEADVKYGFRLQISNDWQRIWKQKV